MVVLNGPRTVGKSTLLSELARRLGRAVIDMAAISGTTGLETRRRKTTSSSRKPYSSSTGSPPGARPWAHASPGTRRCTSSIPA